MQSECRPIPLRPVSVGALLEASEGLSHDEIGRLIDLHFPESLVPEWMIHRAVDTPTLRLLDAIREVGTDE